MMRAKGTILIVDDNEAILTSLKILLHDVFAHVCTTPHPHTILRRQKQSIGLPDFRLYYKPMVKKKV